MLQQSSWERLMARNQLAAMKEVRNGQIWSFEIQMAGFADWITVRDRQKSKLTAKFGLRREVLWRTRFGGKEQNSFGLGCVNFRNSSPPLFAVLLSEVSVTHGQLSENIKWEISRNKQFVSFKLGGHSE